MKSYTYTADLPWKNILLLWAIHGNETCWPVALTMIQEAIEGWVLPLKNWSVTLVPVCNPEAHTLHQRYVDHDLWRIFMSSWVGHEYTLIPKLQERIAQHDIVLDLHSMHSPWDPFIFLDYPTLEATQLVKQLGIESVLCGRPNLYPQDTQWDLHKYAHQQSKISFCLECGSHDNPTSPQVGYNTCIQALIATWVISNQSIEPKIGKAIEIITMRKLYKKEKEWSLIKNRVHGESVWPNELLASYTDGSKVYSAFDHKTIMILPKTSPKLWWEWFYLGSKN
jgi:predicted deacylase